MNQFHVFKLLYVVFKEQSFVSILRHFIFDVDNIESMRHSNVPTSTVSVITLKRKSVLSLQQLIWCSTFLLWTSCSLLLYYSILQLYFGAFCWRELKILVPYHNLCDHQHIWANFPIFINDGVDVWYTAGHLINFRQLCSLPVINDTYNLTYPWFWSPCFVGDVCFCFYMVILYGILLMMYSRS